MADLPVGVLPAEAEALMRDLISQDFSIARARFDPGKFGDALLDLERGPIGVRLIRDRGQWFVEAGDLDQRELFSPTIWEAYLANTSPTLGVPTFAEEVRLFRELFPAISNEIAHFSASALAALHSIRSWAAARRQARKS